MEHSFNPPAHCTHNGRVTFFWATPRLQKAVVKITAQVMQMTTSENVILYDTDTIKPKLRGGGGVQRKCILLDLAHGLVILNYIICIVGSFSCFWFKWG